MPKYNYKCTECNVISTIEKGMKESTRIEHCDRCNTVLERVFYPTRNKWNCSGAYVSDNK